MKRNLSLTLSYLGTSYLGFQKTAAGMSIQEALEQALSRILHEPILIQAASRTDAGVHAEGQVAHFLTEHPMDLNTLQRALNGTLAKDICVHAIEEKASDFHPTLHCTKKEYWYHICYSPVQLPFHRFTSWHFPRPLNTAQIEEGAKALLGSHDFSAFCNDRAHSNRDPLCHLEEISLTLLPEARLKFSVIGDRFLYKMVRNIVGTLAYVGCSKLSPSDLPAILQSKERTRAGITAPAQGLSLHKVYYDIEK